MSLKDIMITLILALILGIGIYSAYFGVGVTNVDKVSRQSKSVRVGSHHSRYIPGGGYFYGK